MHTWEQNEAQIMQIETFRSRSINLKIVHLLDISLTQVLILCFLDKNSNK